MPRSLTPMIALAALALAGCGSSSHHSRTAVAQVGTAAAPLAAGTTAATTAGGTTTAAGSGASGTVGSKSGTPTRGSSSRRKPGKGSRRYRARRDKPRAHGRSGKGAPKAGGKPAGGTASTGSATPSTGTPGSAPAAGPSGVPASVSGPTPVDCLRKAGLINVHLWQPNSWEGYDDGTEKPVFVDGPYSTSAAAKTSASQLQGTEDEAAGGLYAVSAALTSHLGATVNAVAQCLSTTSGHGNL